MNVRGAKAACVRRGAPRAAALALLAAVATAPAGAVELTGSARVSASESDDDGTQTGSLQHAAHLSLSQVITPYLRLRLGASYGELSTELEGDEVASRSTLRPEVSLLYDRPNLSWQVQFLSHRVDQEPATGELRSEAWRSSLSWRPGGGLQLQLAYREDSDASDSSSLGRDVDQRSGRIEALYDRRHWGIGYAGWATELEAPASGLVVEQVRHDVRLHAARDFSDGRVRLSFHGLAGRLDSRTERGAGEPAEPLPAAQGLFAVDLSPAIGELAPAPGLVDGDTTDPVQPAIEIGGANTFRNLGVELAFIRPATLLEIWVDRPSAPDLTWAVYWSADNLVWEPIAGAASDYDDTLLFYTLRFPTTEARYFKAVNVSSNSADDVRVTEVRALRELGVVAGSDERAADLYRTGMSFAWSVTPRVDFYAGADVANDESTVAGVVRRDSRSSSARTGARVELRRDLELGLVYRRSDLDEAIPQEVVRSTRDASANLRWRPLPTVDAAFVSSVRSDEEEGVELSTTTSSRLSVSLQLIERLALISDLSWSRLEGERVGPGRETRGWSQRVEMRPRERLRVAAGYSWSRTESVGGTGSGFERAIGVLPRPALR